METILALVPVFILGSVFVIVYVVKCVTRAREKKRNHRVDTLIREHEQEKKLRADLGAFFSRYAAFLVSHDPDYMPEPIRETLRAVRATLHRECLRQIEGPDTSPALRKEFHDMTPDDQLCCFPYGVYCAKFADLNFLRSLTTTMLSLTTPPPCSVDAFNLDTAREWITQQHQRLRQFATDTQTDAMKKHHDAVLGWISAPHAPVPLLLIPTADRLRHTYIIGKTGSGKSTLLKTLILQDIKRERPVLLFAAEHDLFADLLLYLDDADCDRLVYFDPTDTTEPIVGFNPFDFSEGDSAPAHERDRLLTLKAQETHTIFERATGDLGVKMTTLFQNIAYALIQYPNSTIHDIDRLLDPTNHTLRNAIAAASFIDERTRRFWGTYDRSTYYKTTYEPIMNRLDPLLRPPLSTILSTSSFSLHEMLNSDTPHIFFFDLSKLRGLHTTIIGQLLIASVQQALIRRESIPEAHRIPAFCYIDEFALYAADAEQSFIDLFERARKYKMGVTIAHQVTADIPAKLLDVIVGNAGTVIALQLAASDAPFFTKELQIKDAEGHARPDFLQNLTMGTAYARTPHARQGTCISIPTPDSLFDPFPPTEELYPFHRSKIIATSKATYGTSSSTSPVLREESVPPVPVPAKPSASPVGDAAGVYASAPAAEIVPSPVPLSQDERDLLRFVGTLDELLPVREVYKRCKVSADKGTRLKARLIEQGLLTEVEVSLQAKGRASKLLAVTRDGVEAVGLPPRAGKGGALHQHLQRLIAGAAEQQGYRASIEAGRADGKAVDVCLERDGRRIAVEISVTTRAPDEVHNIVADLGAGYDAVVVLFVDPATCAATQRLLAEQSGLARSEKLYCGLVKDYTTLLKQVA